MLYDGITDREVGDLTEVCYGSCLLRLATISAVAHSTMNRLADRNGHIDSLLWELDAKVAVDVGSKLAFPCSRCLHRCTPSDITCRRSAVVKALAKKEGGVSTANEVPRRCCNPQAKSKER